MKKSSGKVRLVPDEGIDIRNLKLRAAQEFVDTCEHWMRGRKLRATRRWNMNAWAAHLETAPLADGVNPTFDPRHNRTPWGDAFWIAVQDPAGTVVGCVATRLFVTEDFMDLVGSLRLWYDPVPEVFQETRSARPPLLQRVSGRVSHVGGLWVHPACRGDSLPYLLVHLARLMAVDQFRSGWETGVTFEKLAFQPRIRTSYGFEFVVPCFDDYFPPTGRNERIYLNYSRPHHILEILPKCIESLTKAPTVA